MKKVIIFFKKQNFNKIVIYSIFYIITFFIFLSIFIFDTKESYDFPILRSFIIFFASVLLTKYFLYMFISPWYDVYTTVSEYRNKSSIEKNQPLVSVMIPGWNEEVGIIKTIESLINNSYKNTELVIINDGSTDNSDFLIKEFIKKYYKEHKDKENRIELVYFYKKNGGKGAALNTAIELSKGEILISIDADCLVLHDTIKNFVKCFADEKVMAAVGNVKIGNTKNIIGVIQYLEFLFSFYFKKADSLLNTIYIIGGAAGAFRRKTLDIVGVYNTKNITEDIDLSLRIQVAGLKTVYASDAYVYTEGANEISSLMKQRLRWKRGRFETFFENHKIFFSLKKHHNKLLCWIILPLAYFGEIQLSLELLFVVFLYIYSYLINDFSSFISGIVVVSSMFFVQMFFDDKNNKNSKNISFYILAPIGWLLFYIVTYIEFNALIKSLWGLIRKKELKWQRWKREGLID